MKRDFEIYLNDIGITIDILKKRIEQIIDYASNLCNEQLNDIFIEDYIEKDGTREYTHLRLYYKNYILIAFDFITKFNFALVKAESKIFHIQYKFENYDLKNSNEKSQINILVTFVKTSYADMTASKENCDYLMKIINKYYLPNLIA